MKDFNIFRVVNIGRCFCPKPGQFCTLFYNFAHRIDLFGLNAFLDVLKEYLSSEYKNIETLLDYAQKIENRTVYKRLGFGTEYFGFDEDELLLTCKQLISTQLNPKTASIITREGTRWRVSYSHLFKIMDAAASQEFQQQRQMIDVTPK